MGNETKRGAGCVAGLAAKVAAMRLAGRGSGDAPPSAATKADGRTHSGAYIVFSVGGASARGHRRKNDDAFRIGEACDFFALSDGIGGAPDGDVISRVACGKSLEAFEKHGNLAEAFRAGNDEATHVSRLIESPYSGATLLLASCEDACMRFAWVGDSLAFRLRGNAFERLTDIGRDDATNMLDAAVGYEYGIAPRIAHCDVQPGDRFLLCTDGVWETYKSKWGLGCLAQQLGEGVNAPRIADRIVQDAGRYGTDNATAIVLIARVWEKSVVESDGSASATLPLNCMNSREGLS